VQWRGGHGEAIPVCETTFARSVIICWQAVVIEARGWISDSSRLPRALCFRFGMPVYIHAVEIRYVSRLWFPYTLWRRRYGLRPVASGTLEVVTSYTRSVGLCTHLPPMPPPFSTDPSPTTSPALAPTSVRGVRAILARYCCDNPVEQSVAQQAREIRQARTVARLCPESVRAHARQVQADGAESCRRADEGLLLPAEVQLHVLEQVCLL